jgi:hypothetical protein
VIESVFLPRGAQDLAGVHGFDHVDVDLLGRIRLRTLRFPTPPERPQTGLGELHGELAGDGGAALEIVV